MQYAVFVYVSSAQAVIQDLFLFLFKTKDRERSEPNKPREKRTPYYGGKKNQQTKTVSGANTLLKGEKQYNKTRATANSAFHTYT